MSDHPPSFGVVDVRDSGFVVVDLGWLAILVVRCLVARARGEEAAVMPGLQRKLILEGISCRWRYLEPIPRPKTCSKGQVRQVA